MSAMSLALSDNDYFPIELPKSRHSCALDLSSYPVIDIEFCFSDSKFYVDFQHFYLRCDGAVKTQ